MSTTDRSRGCGTVADLRDPGHTEPYFDVPERRILVVDDRPQNLIAIEAALEPFAARLVTARSGREALVRLLEQDFALILLDVQMPDLDGLDTARLIRARERSSETPIIFVTGYPCDAVRVGDAYRLGAVDFLFKPIDVEILRAKAGVLCALQDRTAELARKANELRRAQREGHARELEAQRRELEARNLAVQMEQLAAADRHKDEFLAILAHELRGPLAPLRTAVDLVRCAPERPIPPHVVDIIDRQVGHMTRLVDDLLDVSRLGAGKIELRLEAVCLDAAVDQAIAASQPHLDARRHTLVRTCTRPGVSVWGDPARIVQIVTNLVTNAAKYTPDGGHIEIAWGEHDGTASLVVSDDGCGIASDALEHVFEMFVQAAAPVGRHGGLGIGLALVQRLVALHGGAVTARSPGIGKGSTFEVSLPLAATAALGREIWQPTTTHPRGLRAVLVDDHPDVRDLVGALLAGSGHEVATASDGESGLSMILEMRPDVAIVDVGLPVLDGYEVARAVRSRFGRDQVRLVAMTGFAQESDLRRAFEAGFDAHVVKPASAAAILHAISSVPSR